MPRSSALPPLGTRAPEFSLPSTDGPTVRLSGDLDAPAVLVAFLANHCPYVRHVERGFAQLAGEYQERGVIIFGICPNDSGAYPDDALPRLAEQKERAGFTFPYLVDETQEVTRAYAAACTPDFFLFDGDLALAYRGQMDDSRPRTNRPVTGADLRAALDAVVAGRPLPADQPPSVGCSIKWRPGR